MTGVSIVSGDEDRSDKGIHADIDEGKVKAPNMFERAKEEFDAVIGAIHQRKSSRDESDKMEFKSEKSEDGKKKPNMIRKAKEEIKSLFHHKETPHLHQHKETHGRSDDINENTPVDEVKAPNVFERAKEEIEAVIGTIQPKKNETDGSDSPLRSLSASPEKERAGLGCSLGKGLEKICAPWEEIAAVQVDPPPPLYDDDDPELPTILFTVSGTGCGYMSIPEVAFTRVPAEVESVSSP